jgi:hypothetical protein
MLWVEGRRRVEKRTLAAHESSKQNAGQGREATITAQRRYMNVPSGSHPRQGPEFWQRGGIRLLLMPGR